MTTQPPESPLGRLVSAVVGLGGPLTSVVDHMARVQRAGLSAPDAKPIPEVLGTLLHDVLDPLRDEFAAADVATAAEILERVTEQVTTEIYIVPLPPRRERRRRRGG